MRKLLHLFTLIFFFFCALLLASQAGYAAGPRMVIDEKLFDFKEVNQGSVVTHSFQVRNTGDEPLQIKKVRPGWGCAVAYYDRTIPPGGEGKITIKVKTQGYDGKLRKTVKVYTNDPWHPLENVKIEAFIKTPINLSPRYVILRGSRGERISKTVQIKAELDKPLRIKPIQFNLKKWLNYEIEEIEEGKVYSVRFTSIPNSTSYYRGFLRLRTNYPERPEIFIGIRGRFRNWTSLLPRLPFYHSEHQSVYMQYQGHEGHFRKALWPEEMQTIFFSP
jgi:hypothetical protein